MITVAKDTRPRKTARGPSANPELRQTEFFSLRLTKANAAKFRSLGCQKWLRKFLEAMP